MEPTELRSRISGVFAFPVTPFHPDFSLNIPGLRRNLQRLLQYPICAVVAAAGTGELYSLTPAEHREVVRATVDEAKGRVPVLAAAGFNQPLAVEMAKQAAIDGADGILAFPPYYPNADEDGLLAYYQVIAGATKLGLIIYSRDSVNPGPATVEKWAAIPNLIAWKDGQGDLRRYQMIMNRVGERLHWIGGAGDDLVPGYYSIGIRSYTSSIANVAPGLSLQLHHAAASGDGATLSRLMRDYVTPLYALRARRKGYEVSVMKELMDLFGMSGGPTRPPLANLRPEDRDDLRALADQWRALA